MYVWFLQVVCFYVVIEALEALTKTVTVRSLLLVLSLLVVFWREISICMVWLWPTKWRRTSIRMCSLDFERFFFVFFLLKYNLLGGDKVEQSSSMMIVRFQFQLKPTTKETRNSFKELRCLVSCQLQLHINTYDQCHQSG